MLGVSEPQQVGKSNVDEKEIKKGLDVVKESETVMIITWRYLGSIALNFVGWKLGRV